MSAGVQLRPMRVADLQFAAALTLAEKWNSETLTEFEGFHAHDPAGCLLAECDGVPVGIGVASAYGKLGFLGEIIVVPPWRGRGVGGQLVAGLLAHLRARGVESILLDATEAGAPLYERHGFQAVQRSLRYSGTPSGAGAAAAGAVRPMRRADLDAVCALDLQWWGADRSFFLRRRWQLYPGLCHVLDAGGGIDGYLFGRQRPAGLWIGPWAAASHVPQPESLVEALVASTAAGAGVLVHAGVLASSHRGRAALERLGLAAGSDAPRRMLCGLQAALGDDARILANGTSAKG